MLVGYLVGFLSFVLLHMYAPFEHSLNARIYVKISESWRREGLRESNKACSSKEFLSFRIKRTQCILSLSVPQPQLTNRWGPSNMCIAHWTQSWLDTLRMWQAFFLLRVLLCRKKDLERCLRHSYVECWILCFVKKRVLFGSGCSALANPAALKLLGLPRSDREREKQYLLLYQVL